jgi:hypothetical protein
MRRFLPHLVVALLAACTPDWSVEEDDAPDDDSGQGAPPPTVDDLSIGDQDPVEPTIFSQDVLHTIDISLSGTSQARLWDDPYTYVTGDVEIDGVALDEVGVRLRGKIGSFRTLDGKPKFKLDFNRFVSGRRFHGLESLSLNNSVVDCSYLKEPLGYAVFEAIGAPASRTSYAQVTVNGADYGLYVVVETQDDRYLKERWADGSGNLYDGKYVWYGDRDYVLLDFGQGTDALYQLEEGDDVGHADITAVSEAYLAHAGRPDFYAAMGEVLDWEQVHRVWAGEQYVGQNDGYCLNQNNYRVYFDPEDGRADWIPWDLDYSFLRASDWSRSWSTPNGNLARACFSDPTCRARHREVVAEVLDTVDSLDLRGMAAQLDALTADAADADPRRECWSYEIDNSRAWVEDWLDDRADVVRAQWEL